MSTIVAFNLPLPYPPRGASSLRCPPQRPSTSPYLILPEVLLHGGIHYGGLQPPLTLSSQRCFFLAVSTTAAFNLPLPYLPRGASSWRCPPQWPSTPPYLILPKVLHHGGVHHSGLQPPLTLSSQRCFFIAVSTTAAFNLPLPYLPRGACSWRYPLRRPSSCRRCHHALSLINYTVSFLKKLQWICII